MAKETFVGPMLILGGAAGNMRLPSPAQGGAGAGPIEYSDEVGPSAFWAGHFIPYGGGSKDKTGAGGIAGVYAAYPFKTVNCALAAGAGALTTAANAVAGAALPNVTTYNVARAPVPVTVSGVATTGIALDAALDNATFNVAGTATLLTIANVWRYKIGQWVTLLNGTSPGLAMFAQIIAINRTTGALTVNPPPAVSGSGAITLSNRWNPNLYGNPPPTAIAQTIAAGAGRIVVPEIGNTRGVGILGVTGSPANVPFLITGVDAYNQVQTEIITHPGGAATAWGKKTYDVFVSATPQQSAAFNYTVQTSDLIGLPVSLLSANGLYQVLFGAAGAQVASTPANYTIVPADTTNPATTTTGDPRGGLQVTGNGPGAAPTTPLVLNGTSILTVYQILDPLAVALTSGINPGPVLGVPPT